MLERQLVVLGEAIASKSITLQEIVGSLNALDQFLDVLGEPRVDAIPQRLEELARAVDITFASNKGDLASRLQGSGVLSLASLQVQNVFYRHRLGSDGPELRPHTVTFIEEPEAHLHPHAIYELPLLLEDRDRQVLATTHSPQLATVVDPKALRLIQEAPDGGHSVLDFGPLQEETRDTPRTRRRRFFVGEMEKLKRLVERPFGDLLFAKAIVVGDGATERAFLPPVLRAALGPLAHGISVVDSNGMNSDIVTPVIKFARHAEVPLQILVDDDSAGHKAIKGISSTLLDKELEIIRIVSIEDKDLDVQARRNTAIERMLITFDLEVCRRACHSIGLDPLSHERDTLRMMKDNKGVIGRSLANEFLEAHPYDMPEVRWPEPLETLVERLRDRLRRAE